MEAEKSKVLQNEAVEINLDSENKAEPVEDQIKPSLRPVVCAIFDNQTCAVGKQMDPIINKCVSPDEEEDEIEEDDANSNALSEINSQ